MKHACLFLLIVIILFSCKEEKKSRLITPKMENKTIGPEDPLAFMTDTLSHEEIKKITSHDFKFDFEIDSNQEHMINYNEYIVSCTLTNLTSKTIYLQSSYVFGINGSIDFGSNNSQLTWHFNNNFQTRKFIKANSYISTTTYAYIDSKKIELKPNFKLNIIPFHGNETVVKPIKNLIIPSKSKPIPSWIKVN